MHVQGESLKTAAVFHLKASQLPDLVRFGDLAMLRQVYLFFARWQHGPLDRWHVHGDRMRRLENGTFTYRPMTEAEAHDEWASKQW